MFEKSMEEREIYSLSELLGLCENPVPHAIILMQNYSSFPMCILKGHMPLLMRIQRQQKL